MHPGRADVVTGGTLIAFAVACAYAGAGHDGQRVRHPGRDRAGAAGSLIPTGRMRRVDSLAITVVGHDRPGIIARTAEVLSAYRMNLEDSSMTLLRGHFAMTLICAGQTPAAEVEQALVAAMDPSLAVTVRAVPDEDDPAPVGLDLSGDRARRRPARHRRPAGRHDRRGRRQHHRPDHPADRRSTCCSPRSICRRQPTSRSCGPPWPTPPASWVWRSCCAGWRTTSCEPVRCPCCRGPGARVVHAPDPVLAASGLPLDPADPEVAQLCAPTWWPRCGCRRAASGWPPLSSGCRGRPSASTSRPTRRRVPVTACSSWSTPRWSRPAATRRAARAACPCRT